MLAKELTEHCKLYNKTVVIRNSGENEDDDDTQTVTGFNWMVAILRKIITAATGEKVESKMPPLLEFFGPETLQVMSLLVGQTK